MHRARVVSEQQTAPPQFVDQLFERGLPDPVNTMIANHSGDPWVEMHVAVTERDKFDDASAYVCWGDRLDADETLSTKIDECTNIRGKKFDTLKAHLAAISAHVPEHGLERSVFALK